MDGAAVEMIGTPTNDPLEWCIVRTPTSFNLEGLDDHLQLIILELVVLHDCMYVARKQKRRRPELPPLHYVSKHMRAFSSIKMIHQYHKVIEEYMCQRKQAIWVLVENFHFDNFLALLRRLNSQGKNTGLRRFNFTRGGTGDANPIVQQDLEGPYFNVCLSFNKNFVAAHEARLFRFFKSIAKFEQQFGYRHLRFFYEIDDHEWTTDFAGMVGRMECHDDYVGHERFIMAAFQKSFAEDLESKYAGLPMKNVSQDEGGAGDINEAYVHDEEEADYWKDAMAMRVVLYGEEGAKVNHGL